MQEKVSGRRIDRYKWILAKWQNWQGAEEPHRTPTCDRHGFKAHWQSALHVASTKPNQVRLRHASSLLTSHTPYPASEEHLRRPPPHTNHHPTNTIESRFIQKNNNQRAKYLTFQSIL